MSKSLEDLSQSLMNHALASGADAADVIAVDRTSVSVDVLNGALEHAESAESLDLGVRVIVGQRQACVSTSLLSESDLKSTAERAIAMAKEAPDDPYLGLAEPGELAGDFEIAALELADPSGIRPTPSELEDFGRRAESAALAVEGVSKVQSSSASFSSQDIWLAASNGFSKGYKRSSQGVSCVAITGEGTEMERDYFGDARTFAEDLLPPEEIGKIAGNRTVERAGARKPKTGTYPVLFDERIAGSLVAHLMAAASGDAIARGSSWLIGKLGEHILPQNISLFEDPSRARVMGSRPFDAEGLQSEKREIISEGVLKGWTLDLSTGRKLGLPSTGNASRGVGGPPRPSVGNLQITEGEKSREELIKDMGTGLLITSMIGATINPNSGDYSRGASGFWVEGGEIKYPVNECTIAGNLLEMLLSIVPANDARKHLSRVVPSMLVEGLTIAGD